MTVTEQLKEYLLKNECKVEDTEFGLAIEYKDVLFLHIKNNPEHDNACRLLLNNIFDITEENEQQALVALNTINGQFQWVKLLATGEGEDRHVVVAFDWLCGPQPNFDNAFPEIFSYMLMAAHSFLEILMDEA